jgi:hypothetical protein
MPTSPSGPPPVTVLSRMLGDFTVCRFSAENMRIAPSSFFRIISMTAMLYGSYCRRYAIISFFPASFPASIICWHSSGVSAIGFSHSTCLPAAKPRTVYSACMLLGSTM